MWLAAGGTTSPLADDLGLLQIVGLHFKFRQPACSAATFAAHPLQLPGRTARDQPGPARPVQLHDALRLRCPCNHKPSATPTNSSEAAVASIDDFTQPYQRSVKDPLPLFRRVEGTGREVQQ